MQIEIQCLERTLILSGFPCRPFKIDQNKKSKPFNRLSPESGNRKKVDMQRLSPRYAEKRLPQIYRDLNGVAMLVPI